VPTAVPTGVPAGSAPAALTVQVASTADYGEVLTDAAGLTLYHPAGSGCACETRYHPVLVRPGQMLRLPVLLPGRLGTLTRPGGTLQLTYDGAPLYLFSGDHAPGDVTGVSANWTIIKKS
jgi:predicted lipoprotein with Yx(FWY)xxD motif